MLSALAALHQDNLLLRQNVAYGLQTFARLMLDSRSSHSAVSGAETLESFVSQAVRDARAAGVPILIPDALESMGAMSPSGARAQELVVGKVKGTQEESADDELEVDELDEYEL